jgi:hypothetical protein
LAWNNGFIGQVIVDLHWPIAMLAVLVAWWILCWFLGYRSVEALVRELAAASRLDDIEPARSSVVTGKS